MQLIQGGKGGKGAGNGANVLQFQQPHKNDPIRALEILLDLAKSGRLHGAIITCAYDQGSGVYLFGEYERSPLAANREIRRMQREIPHFSGSVGATD